MSYDVFTNYSSTQTLAFGLNTFKTKNNLNNILHLNWLSNSNGILQKKTNNSMDILAHLGTIFTLHEKKQAHTKSYQT